jgi:hypothetical protein
MNKRQRKKQLNKLIRTFEEIAEGSAKMALGLTSLRRQCYDMSEALKCQVRRS